MASYKLGLTAEQRSDIIWQLKKGPSLGDRQALADYTAGVYHAVTGLNLTEECDKVMADYRRKYRGKCGPNQTFIW